MPVGVLGLAGPPISTRWGVTKMQREKASKETLRELMELYEREFGIDWVKLFQHTVKIHLYLEKRPNFDHAIDH